MSLEGSLHIGADERMGPSEPRCRGNLAPSGRRRPHSPLPSQPARVPHLVEVTRVKVDDAVGDDQHHAEIDGARYPAAEGVEFARAFFLIIGVQARRVSSSWPLISPVAYWLAKSSGKPPEALTASAGVWPPFTCGRHPSTVRRNAGEPLAVAASSQASIIVTPALRSASSAAASRASAR